MPEQSKQTNSGAGDELSLEPTNERLNPDSRLESQDSALQEEFDLFDLTYVLRVRAKMSQLPEADQQILELSFKRTPYEEIAQQLGITIEETRRGVFEARRKLFCLMHPQRASRPESFEND